MPRVFLFCAFSLLLLSSCNRSDRMMAFEWKVYKESMDHRDVSSAMNSLNRILTIDRYNADALDTLAILYEANGGNEQAAKIAFRALNVRESDDLRRVLANANKGLGRHELAIESFGMLLERQPDDLKLLYEMAYSNINLNRLDAALPYIERMIKHPESGSEVMEEFIKEGSQVVPYKAVAFNMLGFIQTTKGQSEVAIRSYQAAVQIFPEYYLAQNNLKVSREKLQTK